MLQLDFESFQARNELTVPNLSFVAQALEAHLDSEKEDIDAFETATDPEADTAMEEHWIENMSDEGNGGFVLPIDFSQGPGPNETIDDHQQPVTELDMYEQRASAFLDDHYPDVYRYLPHLRPQNSNPHAENTQLSPPSNTDPTLNQNPFSNMHGLPADIDMPVDHAELQWLLQARSSRSTRHSSGLRTPHDTFEEEAADLPSVGDFGRAAHVCDFVEKWIERWYIDYASRRDEKRSVYPRLSEPPPQHREAFRMRTWLRPQTVEHDEVENEDDDVQGIDWTSIGTTRRQARSVRKELFSAAHAQMQTPHWWPEMRYHTSASSIGTRTTFSTKDVNEDPKRPPNSERFFKFRRLRGTHHTFINHYQLRNMVTVTAPDDIFYASQTAHKSRIMRADPSGPKCVMDLNAGHLSNFSTTCLCASDDTLVAGGFEGNYAYKGLRSGIEASPTVGQVTPRRDGISNHVHTFRSRQSGLTQAAFCSNDKSLRLLDCTTNQFIGQFQYDFMVNCSATTANGQMRLVVGDGIEPGFGYKSLVTNAATGEVIHTLRDHKQDAFACAWADDNRYFATGAQDNLVMVYDARRWDHPLKVLSSEVSCPRSMRFSPSGSGRPLLIVAEAEDIVSVIDARTFDKCQVLDSFGPLGGMGLSLDGQTLVIANSDRKFGGLLEYERTASTAFGSIDSKCNPYDWENDIDLERNANITSSRIERERRHMTSLVDLVV